MERLVAKKMRKLCRLKALLKNGKVIQVDGSAFANGSREGRKSITIGIMVEL